MRRWGLLLVAACLHSNAPKTNEVVAKTGRQLAFKANIERATFCSTCGRDAPVTIEFGAPAKVRLVVPLCYAHAHSKIGDHDHVQVSFVDDNIAATAGQLDIDDCSSKHVVAKLWATFPDKRRVDAVIDTDLVEPK